MEFSYSLSKLVHAWRQTSTFVSPSYVSQDLFTSHCGTEQQGVPRKHMVAIVRVHCLPELSEEAPARSVPL